MDAATFDQLIRRLVRVTTRRRATGAFLAGVVGLATNAHPAVTAAGKRKKRKTPRFNVFGCLNVGAKCRGRAAFCCSGICKGTKPRKGKKDKSRCIGHDESGCRTGEGVCGSLAGACTTVTGRSGNCLATTGNAGYCAGGEECQACTRDWECQRANNNPTAACAPCAGCAEGTACVIA